MAADVNPTGEPGRRARRVVRRDVRVGSSEELRAEAARILSRSEWWADELIRARQNAVVADIEGRLGVVDVAVIATDLEGMVTHWNDGAKRLYGWTRQEVVNRPLHDLPVGPRDAEDAERITQAVRQTGNWQGEFRARRKDGTELLAYALHAAIENERGQPIGSVGVSFDPSREPSEP